MTTATHTIYNYTCNFCEKIAKFFTNIQWSKTFETIGVSRAAAELTRQGYHKEAKALMLSLDSIRKEGDK